MVWGDSRFVWVQQFEGIRGSSDFNGLRGFEVCVTATVMRRWGWPRVLVDPLELRGASSLGRIDSARKPTLRDIRSLLHPSLSAHLFTAPTSSGPFPACSGPFISSLLRPFAALSVYTQPPLPICSLLCLFAAYSVHLPPSIYLRPSIVHAAHLCHCSSPWVCEKKLNLQEDAESHCKKKSNLQQEAESTRRSWFEFESVRECSRVFEGVRGCSKMFEGVRRCSSNGIIVRVLENVLSFMSSSLWELSLREGRSGLREEGHVYEEVGSARRKKSVRGWSTNDYLETSHAIGQTEIDWSRVRLLPSSG